MGDVAGIDSDERLLHLALFFRARRRRHWASDAKRVYKAATKSAAKRFLRQLASPDTTERILPILRHWASARERGNVDRLAQELWQRIQLIDNLRRAIENIDLPALFHYSGLIETLLDDYPRPQIRAWRFDNVTGVRFPETCLQRGSDVDLLLIAITREFAPIYQRLTGRYPGRGSYWDMRMVYGFQYFLHQMFAELEIKASAERQARLYSAHLRKSLKIENWRRIGVPYRKRAGKNRR